MDLKNYKTVSERRKAIEESLKVSLINIATYSLREDVASSRNCENMIGAVQIPLGLAGPLLIQGTSKDYKNYYIPLATTEGALVASVNRGIKAITHSGGVKIINKKIGITRAPVFKVEGINEGNNLIKWVNDNFQQIKDISEKTSSHLTLLKIKSWMIGKDVFLRFHYDSKDAMGMNMATIATDSASDFIKERTNAKLISISGNMCVDKKPNALNFIEGRGVSIWAEVHLNNDAIMNILKTNASALVETARSKLTYGSQLSLSIGANAQMANVLAAIFLATGQDIAHVAECSMGITTVESEDEGVYFAIYLPDLVVGTVGGGTQLETQKEALEILGFEGGGRGTNGLTLAEIIGGAVLAGEISLLASLSENTLTISHKKLGRGEK